MMVAKNNITGDSIMTKAVSDSFRDNFDRIFRNPSPQQVEVRTEDRDAEQADQQTEAPSAQG